MSDVLFTKTKHKGREAEQAVIDYYISKGANVIDVSNNEQYFDKDIDLFINRQSVEVKYGGNIQTYGDIVIETISNLTTNKKGWFFTSEADIVIFYEPLQKVMYQFVLRELREWYRDHIAEIQEKTIYKNEFADVIKASVIAFLPLEQLAHEIKGFRRIQI